ncbi:MAG: polysaccharide deacetylase family protein [Verrucomicrobiales bacterium]|nr:polysaccharide deacetylase family protein [Verrucomicrobiales bacterium]
MPLPSLRLLLTMCAGGWLLVGSGCSRVKDKLDRLASAGKVEVAPEEPPMTDEEKRLDATLHDPGLFNPDEAAAAVVPKAQAFELNKACTVSILGYHDFRARGGDAMVINKDKFREQMQAIKDSGIPVVRLEDVLEWREGRNNVPEECFVITMDDGWEGVYEYAYPVLKEFAFPFTIYLYKNYVNIGGRSLSWEEIREMMGSGLCSVGSHSVTHASMTQRKGRSDENYELYLLGELKDSKEFLERNLGVDVTSFAYPYGNYNETIRDMASQVGYRTMVTVNGSKTSWETPLGELNRFIIHGVNDGVFKLATTFRGRGNLDSARFTMADAKDDQGEPLVRMRPGFDEVITDRQPLIEASLGKLGDIDPNSVKMYVGGLGSVAVDYDAVSKVARYKVPLRLRREECEVSISFQRPGALEAETLTWRFKIDLAADYLPRAAASEMKPAEAAAATRP